MFAIDGVKLPSNASKERSATFDDTAKAVHCNACALSKQCLKGPMKPNDGRGRQVIRFEHKPKDDTNPSERMRKAIDSPKGCQLYSQRFGTVEPVFANIRHNMRLTRFNHRGHTKVNTGGTRPGNKPQHRECERLQVSVDAGTHCRRSLRGDVLEQRGHSTLR